MATDDLDTPLGKAAKKKRKTGVPPIVPKIVAGALGLAVLGFAAWALIVDDPYGGEPSAVASIAPSGGAETRKGEPAAQAAAPTPPAEAAKPASPAQTITIIDGSTGKTQEVTLPGADAKRAPVGTRLLEVTRHGTIPKIAPDGTRPSDAYARAPQPTQNPDGPKVAIIITGLGVGASGTADALSKMPGPVTLAFMPYGNDLENLASRARADGHEILLQVPMEPFDYPDNDPGPQTLLTSLSPEQNVDRLYWLMSRFQGYVGVANFMGARFTASEPAISPVLREAAKRGLIYIDDGSSPRSLAGQIAGANKMSFAKADLILDAAPAPAEIDKALTKLEALARQRGIAVAIGSALPVTIERVTKWAKAAGGRGIALVPISVAAVKPKSS